MLFLKIKILIIKSFHITQNHTRIKKTQLLTVIQKLLIYIILGGEMLVIDF